MAAAQINPFDQFFGADGVPLTGGYVYIGQANTDPRQFPIAVYYDSALTIPAVQPLRTNAGYLTRNGAPALVYLAGDYSLLVTDKKGQQVFYVASYSVVQGTPSTPFVEQTYQAFTTGGVAPAYTLTPSPAITAYKVNQRFNVTFANDGTPGSNTINVSGLGTINLKQYNSEGAKVGAIIRAGMKSDIIYDGADWVVLDALATNVYSTVKGFQGDNNAATPNTKYDFFAVAATLTNPATGETMSFTNASTITCDIGLSGPAVNGRDQAAAFTNAFVYLYYISDGVNLRTIASLAAPSVGPTMPVGYRLWALASIVLVSAGAFLSVKTRGSYCAYTNAQPSLVAASSLTEVSVIVSSAVPVDALTYDLFAEYSASGAATGAYSCLIKLVATINLYRLLIGIQAASGLAYQNLSMRLANIGRSYIYQTSSTSTSVSSWIVGYTIPNGDS